MRIPTRSTVLCHTNGVATTMAETLRGDFVYPSVGLTAVLTLVLLGQCSAKCCTHRRWQPSQLRHRPQTHFKRQNRVFPAAAVAASGVAGVGVGAVAMRSGPTHAALDHTVTLGDGPRSVASLESRRRGQPYTNTRAPADLMQHDHLHADGGTFESGSSWV